MDSLAIAASDLPPAERARLIRHSAIIERASNMLGHDSTKMATLRSHITSYRQGALSAHRLIDAFFALFAETSSNALGTLVREVADLFEDKIKAEALRRAWQDWRAINEDYPSLPGLGGMHGATTPSSGWAAAAAANPTAPLGDVAQAAQSKHTTRVLKLKNSTRSSSGAGIPTAAATAAATPGGSGSGSATDWAPAPLAPSASAFPALPGKLTSASVQPSWVGGTTSTPKTTTPSAGTSYLINRKTGLGGNNEEAFPALPAAPKPTTTIFGYGTGAVRRDVGAGRVTGFSWGGSTGNSPGPGAVPDANDTAEADTSAKGGKKKKKQILVQWG
jgi:hypothetical protein